MIIDFEQPRRRLVVVSFLHNPSGNQLSVSEAMDVDGGNEDSVFCCAGGVGLTINNGGILSNGFSSES